MAEKLKNFTVEIAEEFMGEVVGKLCHIGSWANNIENHDGVITITTKIPISKIEHFDKWLIELTAGNGVLTENG